MDKEKQLVGDLKTRMRVGGRGKSRSILGALLVSAILGSLIASVVGTGSAAAAAECPNEEFRIEKSATLPDCRAYEQVSPTLKEFGAVYFYGGDQVSTDGSAIAFQTEGPLPGSQSGTLLTVYVGRRTSSGWAVNSTLPVQTPLPGGAIFPQALSFSNDLSRWTVLSANPALTPDAQPENPNIYEVEGSGAGPFKLITLPQGVEGERTVFSRVALSVAAQSPDLSTVLVSSPERLLGETGNGGRLYEYRNGRFSTLDILPSGELAAASASAAGSNLSKHLVSDDGSIVYFVAVAPGSPIYKLYARINDNRTVEVAESQKNPAESADIQSNFVGASADGTLAFFTSRNELTEDANTGVEDAGNDLYVKNLQTGNLSDLTVDDDPEDAATGAAVQGVVGTSEDGAYVYYVATGVLAPGASRGQPNLYLIHDGAVRYIATLDPSDVSNWFGVARELTSYLAPDGRHLLLSSKARLTSYDNTDAISGEADTEIYLYSAQTNNLTCVSCRPDGARPTSSTSLNAELIGAFGKGTYPRTPMTDDGAGVVFATGESLVPQDSNGISDVYESKGGQLHLLSPGNSSFATKFLGMSPSGQDVFIGTSERLATTDKDDLSDVYDVREDGGFPQVETAEKACAGPECPRTEVPEPEAADIGSSGLLGPKNLVPRRKCAAGKHPVTHSGKTQCVSKKRHKSKPKTHRGNKKSGKSNRKSGSGKGGK
jgi:hypothetical protein